MIEAPAASQSTAVWAISSGVNGTWGFLSRDMYSLMRAIIISFFGIGPPGDEVKDSMCDRGRRYGAFVCQATLRPRCLGRGQHHDGQDRERCRTLQDIGQMPAADLV